MRSQASIMSTHTFYDRPHASHNLHIDSGHVSLCTVRGTGYAMRGTWYVMLGTWGSARGARCAMRVGDQLLTLTNISDSGGGGLSSTS